MPVTEQSGLHSEPQTLPDAVPEQRLVEYYAPCFTLALKIQAAEELGTPQELRSHSKSLLEQCEDEARAAGCAEHDVERATFAVVALIDEAILSTNWAGTEEWMKTPLQLEFYDQFDAGEVFFDRLDNLLDNPQSHAVVLEVYHLCMTLGFRGKYQLQKQDELRDIIDSTAEALARVPATRTPTLSPHGRPRDQAATEMQSKLPNWVIAAAAALLGVLLYGGMYLYVSASAHEVARTIRSLGTAG
jgi:type VI secretion system protein ImpK